MLLRKIMLFLSVFLLWTFGGYSQNYSKSAFDFDAYYKAFSSEDTVLFNEQLSKLESIESKFKPAFAGALLMKKSKSMKTIREKLDMFKEGRDMLEKAIEDNPENVEYRFLRLATQENAPAFLNYNDNKRDDAEFIKFHFQELSESTQNFVMDYAQQSETLKPEDLSKK